jgi:iron complex transport system substrate-binding protein
VSARLLTGLAALLLAACRPVEVPPAPAGAERPQRIVSLDYCADQYLLKLADREQILALSPEAVKGYSYMRDSAAALPAVRPVAEDVLMLKPDLVLRSYGGGADAAAFFERAGVPVLQMGWVSSIDGDGKGSITGLIHQLADGLGQSQRGHALVAQLRARMAALNADSRAATALYMTPGGVTTGPGSLLHEMLTAAGLTNFQSEPGWHPLPLERLAYEQPDLLAVAFFESLANQMFAWSAARHPVVRDQLEEPGVVPLQGAWTACGGWFLLDAVEALAAGKAL